MVQSIDEARRQHGRGGRVPPHNLQAEESVLGAMLLSRDAIAAVTEVRVAADDFYRPIHGHIFDAITSLYERGDPVDAVTVAEELARDGLLEAIGGPATLVSLQAATPATSNAARYARIVEEHALLRRLIGVAGEIAELGYELPDDVGAAVDRAEAMVFEVAQRRVADTMAPLRELLSQNLDRLEALYERGEAITGIPTGYSDLDHQLCGLQPSNLVVVGARPAMGKTSFALGAAAHAALEQRVPVLVFSLEMSHLELTQRLLCAEARVDATRMRNGRLQESDWAKINNAIGRLAEAPIYIDDNPNVTVMEIRAKARRLKSRLGDLGMIVVDYLQLMTGRSGAESRQVEVSEMSRGLKILARELRVPVVALSQLSRNLEMRADKRPVLADLRESGCLTADTRVLRADTGVPVSLGELLLSGERDIPVWTLDERLALVPGTMTHVFPSGIKRVYQLRLACGRRVKASANHPFLTLDGWRRLDELALGTRIAVPSIQPPPARPVAWRHDEVVLLAHLLVGGHLSTGGGAIYSGPLPTTEVVARSASQLGMHSSTGQGDEGWWVRLDPAGAGGEARAADDGPCWSLWAWLDELALCDLPPGVRSVPRPVFALGNDQLALFLRHLWAATGYTGFRRGRVAIELVHPCRRLIDDLQQLLLRFEVESKVSPADRGAGDGGHNEGDQARWRLDVSGEENQARFLRRIGVEGNRALLLRLLAHLAQVGKPSGTSRETVSVEEWEQVPGDGASLSRWLSESTKRHEAHASAACVCPPRRRLGRVAATLGDVNLERLAEADVAWHPIVGIDALGEEPVYDATVAGTHNFVANGITVENSIEQDADVVMFIYRDEVYNTDSPDRGTAEVIVAKHRNGPTGKTRLAFLDHYTRFANMAPGV